MQSTGNQETPVKFAWYLRYSYSLHPFLLDIKYQDILCVCVCANKITLAREIPLELLVLNRLTVEVKNPHGASLSAQKSLSILASVFCYEKTGPSRN